MKKSLLVLALAFGVTTAFAQDLTSKKGEPILPEADDWGIAVDATPFLKYAGNFIGGNGLNAAPTWDFNNSNFIIMGKMFKDEKTAYRVGINIGLHTASQTNLVNQDNFTGTGVTPLVTDKASASSTAFGVTAGMEMRRGKTRLQGYYGADFGIWFGGSKRSYTYGNAFGTGASAGTSTNPTSTTWAATDTAGGAPTVSANGTFGASGGRTTSWKSGSTFTFGVRAFVGAEYFFMPKLSLGGEFGFGLGFTSTGAGSTSTEQVLSGTSPTIQTTATGKGFAFNLGTDNRNSFFGPTGTLRLNMYF